MKKLNRLKRFLLGIACLVLMQSLSAQVSIVSASVIPYNVTPRALGDICILNTRQNLLCTLQAQLFNSAGEVLMAIKSTPFVIHNGMNLTATLGMNIASIEYGSSSQATYVKTNHILPSGQFKYCCALTINAIDDVQEYCTELESDMSSYLVLVSPENKDTIDTPNPDLVWNHSEPFSMLATGEYFRMVVVQLTPDQTADMGVSVNVPIMMANNLLTHSVLYPFSAQILVPGQRYGWQVQQLTNGVITNKSEAWEFTLRVPTQLLDNKYAKLRNKLDGGFYTTVNNKVFFRFDEPYASNVLAFTIFDSKMQQVKTKASNQANPVAASGLKNKGYNCFEVDLNGYDISSGYYTMEVKNEKNEKQMLRFFVQ